MKKSKKFISLLISTLLASSLISSSVITTNAIITLPKDTTTNKNSITTPAISAVFNTKLLIGKVGEISWSFSSLNCTLTLNGNGEIPDLGNGKFPWEQFKTNIKKIVLKDGITKIGICAFSGCENINDILIPKSVSQIGCNAFQGCSSLTKITILNSKVDIAALQKLTIKQIKNSKLLSKKLTASYTLGDPNSTVIYSYDNSYAKSYASRYGYKFEKISCADYGHNFSGVPNDDFDHNSEYSYIDSRNFTNPNTGIENTYYFGWSFIYSSNLGTHSFVCDNCNFVNSTESCYYGEPEIFYVDGGRGSIYECRIYTCQECSRIERCCGLLTGFQ